MIPRPDLPRGREGDMALEQRETEERLPAPAIRAAPELLPSGSEAEAGTGAGAQAILTAIGETVYEWDLATDRLRWGSNAGEVLGIRDMRTVASGSAFGALV